MVRTRMAPSPTGEYHIGSLRTMLYNYAWAKKNDGQFLLRIEDTDRTRLVEGALDRILEDVIDYGLDWDEGPRVEGDYGPYIQSERISIYPEYATKLVEAGHAYHCFCTADVLKEMRDQQQSRGERTHYDRRCRNISLEEAHKRIENGDQYVIRLKMPDNETVTYNDIVLGEISFNTDDVDDQILLKSDGFPTYHLAVVVDDHLMEISHILRGMEWVSSMPKHILLYRYLGWEMPETGHLPLLLDPGGGKMSKRHGSTHARAFLNEGYLPEAMINFLALLGWTHPQEKDIFTLDEFISVFDIHQLHKSNAVFDRQKLDWMNGVYIRELEIGELVDRLISFDSTLTEYDRQKLTRVAELTQERLKILSEFKELTLYFFEDIDVSIKDIVQKGKDENETRNVLKTVHERLSSISETDWNDEAVEKVLHDLKEELEDWTPKQLFMSIRIAISGRTATPSLFETVSTIGKEKVISRLASLI